MQLALVSRTLVQEAGLLGEKVTDAEKLRLGILLGCVKHGLHRTPDAQGYALHPVPADLVAEYSKAKSDSGLKGRKLPMKKFLSQPEEAQFFSMSLTDRNNQQSVRMRVKELVTEPSAKLRALLPAVQWDPLPTLEDLASDTASQTDNEDEDDSSSPVLWLSCWSSGLSAARAAHAAQS